MVMQHLLQKAIAMAIALCPMHTAKSKRPYQGMILYGSISDADMKVCPGRAALLLGVLSRLGCRHALSVA